MIKKIVIKGAKEHNLKNISLEIPKDKFVVITGLSGSGKSSLAFDTVYAEGQRRYVESLSAYARQFLDKMKKPNVDLIEGLSPAISIEQKNTSKNPRSTVATVTEIYDYMRVLYARAGIPYSPFTGKPITSQTVAVGLIHIRDHQAEGFIGIDQVVEDHLGALGDLHTGPARRIEEGVAPIRALEGVQTGRDRTAAHQHQHQAKGQERTQSSGDPAGQHVHFPITTSTNLSTTRTMTLVSHLAAANEKADG